MRHRRRVQRLGTSGSHHRALLRNLAISLIQEEKLTTTLAKARQLSRFMERLITVARRGDTAAYRHVWRYLHHKGAMKRLVRDIVPRFEERPGGYTRVIRTGQFRMGDGAELAIVCFVGSEEVRVEERQKRLEQKAKRV